jgi:hypothetical protein
VEIGGTYQITTRNKVEETTKTRNIKAHPTQTASQPGGFACSVSLTLLHMSAWYPSYRRLFYIEQGMLSEATMYKKPV